MHREFCQQLNIPSYPTIKIYHRDGRIDQYRGKHKARELAMFRNRVIRPSFLEADAQLLEHFILLDDVVIVMHPLAQSDNWNIYDRFTALAARYRDRFTFLIGPSVTESRPAAVICYNNLDDVKHVATDTQTTQALEDFVVLCAEPLIPELTTINKAEYISTGKNVLHYFASTEAEKEAYRAEIRPLAKKYSGKLKFIIRDLNEYSDLLGGSGGATDSTTALVLENSAAGALYPFPGSVKLMADDVERHLIDISSGKLQPANRSPGKEQHESGHDEL